MSTATKFSNSTLKIYPNVELGMGIRVVNIVLSILLLLLSLSTNAAINSAFQAKQPVMDQSNEARQEAFKVGMETVLHALSGKASFQSYPTIIDALDNATHYVSSYSYVNIPVFTPSNDSSQEQDQTNKPSTQLALHINFDRAAITTLLKNNSLPVWTSMRPPVLIWLVQTDDQGNNTIATDEDNTPLQQSLKKTFSALSLSILYPIMDFKDITMLPQEALTPTTKDAAAIIAASKRYKTPAILIIHTQSSANMPDQLNGECSLLFQGMVYQQAFSDLNDDAVAQTAANISITPIASFYGMDQSKKQTQHISLTIQGINSVKEYTSLVNYLKTQSSVSQVIPTTINQTTAQFTLTTKNNASQIAASFSLDPHFSLVQKTSDQISISNNSLQKNSAQTMPPSTSTNAGASLIFRWNP